MSITTVLRDDRKPAPSARGTLRPIDGVYASPGLHWVGDGFRVAGYFAQIPEAVRKLDPFLLLDYHPTYDYAPSARARGVGVHPHRGFETVTLAFQGSVAHHDSAGGGGVIGPGDAQWMTAASGILHKEYHEANYARRGGPFQMAQLWVNLPRRAKMAPPAYQPITSDRMGIVTLADGGGTVRVIAGELQGVRGPATTFTPIDLYDARLAAGGRLDLALPAEHTVAILVMSGEASLNGRDVHEGDLVLFERRGDRVEALARSEAQLLVMSGEPIAEPVVQYGPFVMNTKHEIVQAIPDFERGAFGTLED